MGMFLALSGVIGKTHKEVLASLTNYANSVNGGLQQEDNINSDNDNCCIVEEADGNTTIVYPDGYLEWDDSSAFISGELNAVVFSMHIHDGDFWMYKLYSNGQIVDQFNPIPDYWEDNIGDAEIESWRGNAATVAKHVSYINPIDIAYYLVRWDLDEEEPSKAYPTDVYSKEDWQLVDFMDKLKLPYPLDDNGDSKGLTYKLWTKQLKLADEAKSTGSVSAKAADSNKPWWKFW